MEVKVLATYISEEIQDAFKYMEAYRETGCCIYIDIAGEELSHAHLLNKMYMDNGGGNSFCDEIHMARQEWHNTKHSK